MWTLEELEANFVVGQERLNELVRDTMNWVASCLKSPHHSWMPHLCVLCRNGVGAPEKLVLCALAVNFNEHAEKHSILTQLGKKFYQDGVIPIAAVLSSEAWAIDDTKRVPGIEVRHHDQKKEVIVVAGTTLRFVFAHASMPITRMDDDVIVPGQFGEITPKGDFPLIDSFFRGFFSACPGMAVGFSDSTLDPA